MNISDPIADMLTRVRNASRARHTEVVVPASRTKREIARILKDEGFIADVSEAQDGPTIVLKLTLKYVDGKVPVVSGLKRISKPGLRVYARKTDIPRVLGGLGIVIVSTSQGIMTGAQGRARRRSPRVRLVGGTTCPVSAAFPSPSRPAST
jgi:small subunit ribosomal protein S8